MKISVQSDIPMFEGASTDLFLEILSIKNQWHYHLYPKHRILGENERVRLKDQKVKVGGEKVAVNKEDGHTYIYPNFTEPFEVLGRMLIENKLITEETKQGWLNEYEGLNKEENNG